MFTELLAPDFSISPGEQQRRARICFLPLVTSSSLRLWHPGDAIVDTKNRLLIGVATYALRDLRLLDELEAYNSGNMGAVRIDVFNTLDCVSGANFARYIPGLDVVYQTPVAGLWIRGTLARRGAGLEAVQIAEDLMKSTSP